MATIMRTRATWTGVAGAPAYSNLYWTGGTGNADVCAAAHAAFLTAIDPLQADVVAWTLDTNVAFIDSVTGDITGLTGVPADSGDGDATGHLLPPATQALLHLRTGVFQGGREIRGRINIPYLTEAASSTTGTLEPASQAVIVAAAEDLIDPLLGVSLVVWSRLTGAAPVVTQITSPTEFAVLRSRRD